jgi:ABC-type nitrate/sulfonate/bicarbonate transport system permease component
MLDCYSRSSIEELTARSFSDLETGNWSSNSWQVLTVDTMYVGLLAIAVLGFVFSLVLDEIERMLIPWKANA